MRGRWMAAGALAALTALAATGASRTQPGPLRFGYEQGTEGWQAVPPPAGVAVALSITRRAGQAKVGVHALEARYRVEPGKLAGVTHAVTGLAGGGIRVWLRTDVTTTVVLGAIERDGSAYLHAVPMSPGAWRRVEVAFASLTLSDDSRDENGRLDPDQVGTLAIGDAAGFLPGAAPGPERILWIDEYEVAGDIEGPERAPYVPLLQTGPPAPSGARVTVGVTYPPGRFGRGFLADAPGELAAVPVQGARGDAGWSGAEGTVEMWVSPRADHLRPDACLFAMQEEPFMAGLRGSLQVFHTSTGQIVLLLNGHPRTMAASPPIRWRRGEWHHVAASWGPAGMRLYLDGRVAGRNSYAGGVGVLAADLVVGNQAWTIASNRFADAVLDDLRLSRRARGDAEIVASASGDAPLESDEATLALEHFDASPVPPLRLRPAAAPWHASPAGRSVRLAVEAPAPRDAAGRLTYTVRTPAGAVVRRGSARWPARAASVSLPLAALRSPGFYRLDLRLGGGDGGANRGAVWFRVGGASARAAGAPPLFGASACYAEPEDNADFFRQAAAAGVRTLRMPFEWAEIEPREGHFVWDRYDRIVRWARRGGIELIPTFLWENPQPAWAGPGNVAKPRGVERYPPTDLKKWSAFVYRVVGRYRGTVRWWIPANEPNLPRYWHPKPDAAAYVALLRATREAARRADPRAKLLGCSVAGMDLGFLEACFRAGALRYCDAVGVHPYICPRSPDEPIPVNVLDPGSMVGTFQQGLEAAGRLIARHGGRQKLWLDEVGQPYRDDFVLPDWGVPEPTAAEYLAKLCAAALASRVVDRVLWFSFRGGEYGSFALVRPDGSPTLPLAAYAAAASRLEGAVYAGGGGRGAGLRSVRARRGGRVVEVVWRPTGKSEVRLRAGERASDLYGFPVSGPRLTVGAAPIYVERTGARR